MSKSIRFCAVLFLGLALLLGNTPVLADEPIPTTKPFKAIVKIRPFALDVQNDLSGLGFGSGIIISPTGLLLTNNHVIEVASNFDNSDLDAAYLVCLPANTVDEPDCSYMAKLIAKNKDLDVALLQIENIPGLASNTSYPFLELSQIDTANVNDPVTAIGYPDIGGSTATTTQGIVSGKTEKYGKQWIKTDAVISFGSSGGAAINSTNKVIGITSAGHSDLLGSLGYIINIISLNDWITTNKNSAVKTTALTSRLLVFANKEKSLNDSNVFENINPRFTITKPADWEFTYESENELDIYNPADEDGGYVSLILLKQAYQADVNSILPMIRKQNIDNGTYGFFKVNQDSNIQINRKPAKRLNLHQATSDETIYAMPIRNYILIISFDYGLDAKDKAIVESLIQSIDITKAGNPLPELKKYSNKKPQFSLSVDKDWVILENNNPNQPIRVVNKKYRDFYIDVEIEKMDDETKRLNNEGMIKRHKDMVDNLNKIGGTMDISAQLVESNAHFKVNDKFTDAIKEIVTLKTPSNKKLIVYGIDYYKKINNEYLLDVSMVTTNTNTKTIATYKKEFERLMKSFILTAPAAPKKDSDKDGLNDDDEKKFRTNPNKADSDGDGYSDWIEINNGYNPNGPGKMKK